MGRGRPKGSKNKVKIGQKQNEQNVSGVKVKPKINPNIKPEIKNISPISPVKPVAPVSKTVLKAPKQVKDVERCKRCGGALNETPYVIDTTFVTGIADYHRDHPRRVKVCRKCALDLSRVIDEWLGEYPKKF